MARYELSLTPDYVPDWGIVEAFRELFQNAVDQSSSEGNEMFWNYNSLDKVFTLGNKSSVLTTTSLLLGSSTKTEDESLIGKYGEGYKIALLVLTRLNKNVTIYNYGAREVWRPKFINSKRYQSKLLVVDVDRKHIWSKVPDNNLRIQIENVSSSDVVKIKESILFLQENYESIQSGDCEILTDERHRGKLFVNGLYVSSMEGFKYGYNLPPDLLDLDRDRKTVREFDLTWETSRLWSEVDATKHSSKIIELLVENSREVQYISHRLTSSKNSDEIKERAFDFFIEKYGPNSVPISSEEDKKRVDKMRNAVIVSEVFKNVVTGSSRFDSQVYIPTKSLKEQVSDWLLKHEAFIPVEAIEELNKIIESSEEY